MRDLATHTVVIPNEGNLQDMANAIDAAVDKARHELMGEIENVQVVAAVATWRNIGSDSMGDYDNTQSESGYLVVMTYRRMD